MSMMNVLSKKMPFACGPKETCNLKAALIASQHGKLMHSPRQQRKRGKASGQDVWKACTRPAPGGAGRRQSSRIAVARFRSVHAQRPGLGLADFPHLLHCPCNSEGQPDSTCVHLKSSGRERGCRSAMLAAVVVPLCHVAAVTFELERRHNPASTLAVLKGQGHIGSFSTKLLAGVSLSCM